MHVNSYDSISGKCCVNMTILVSIMSKKELWVYSARESDSDVYLNLGLI